MTNLDSILKSRDITLQTSVHLVKDTVFSSSHVWMWVLDYKENWAPKNWCFWTVVLEKTLESPLDCKESKSGNPKGNQSWIFIARTDAEAEAPILWPPDAKKWLICKNPDAGKDWRQEEKGTTENEMVGWHHQLNGHEFEQAPGFGDGQGSVLQATWLQRVKNDWVTELNWTEALLYTSVHWWLDFRAAEVPFSNMTPFLHSELCLREARADCYKEGTDTNFYPL